MSDENDLFERADVDADTLPMGEEVSKIHVLEAIVDVEWKRPPEDQRASGGPAEAYRCELDDCRLRFERNGRIWQGFLDPADTSPTIETSAAENIGKVARELKKVLASWRG